MNRSSPGILAFAIAVAIAGNPMISQAQTPAATTPAPAAYNGPFAAPSSLDLHYPKVAPEKLAELATAKKALLAEK